MDLKDKEEALLKRLMKMKVGGVYPFDFEERTMMIRIIQQRNNYYKMLATLMPKGALDQISIAIDGDLARSNRKAKNEKAA